jgi:hypothetical protein
MVTCEAHVVSSDVAEVGVRWRIGLCAGFKAGWRIAGGLSSHVDVVLRVN